MELDDETVMLKSDGEAGIFSGDDEWFSDTEEDASKLKYEGSDDSLEEPVNAFVVIEPSKSRNTEMQYMIPDAHGIFPHITKISVPLPRSLLKSSRLPTNNPLVQPEQEK